MAVDDDSMARDDRCAECGAKLTADELQAVMESGGPPLCTIHAAEDEPGLAAGEAEFTL